jgi:hypothetical protein
MLSNFELAALRCCSKNKDKKAEGCFEVNGFGGVSVLEKPCRYLDMDQTMESGELIENTDLIDEQRIEKEQRKMMSKFELSIVRCLIHSGHKSWQVL